MTTISEPQVTTNILGKLRKFFWPIEGQENRKFLPMAAMMFFILMNYSMLRSIKDGFIVPNIGAEALGFLKTYGVTPSAIIFLLAYTWLCNVMNSRKVFYTVTTFFVSYLAIFTFFLYPNQALVMPNPQSIEALAVAYPFFKWFIRIIGYWPFATFYIISELWGSVMLSLLFWQFANQTTRTDEAKRFYSTYGILGNLGLLATSYLIDHFLGGNSIIKTSLKFTPILSIAVLSGLAIMGLYYWINQDMNQNPALYTKVTGSTAKKPKTKLSMGESLKVIFSSRYLALIAILVITYGISTNLIENIWKDKIKQLYTTAEDYTMFMGRYQYWQGLGAILFMLVGSNIVRRVSWITAAAITPLMMLVTGMIFFFFISFDFNLFAGISPLVIGVYAGFVQGVLSKATKYSLFDSTKEMAYIPLDDELKSKGKAAVDVVAGRAGKSGGGIITSTAFMIFSNLTFAQATPYLATIFFIMIIAMLYAVRNLNIRYQEQLKEHSY